MAVLHRFYCSFINIEKNGFKFSGNDLRTCVTLARSLSSNLKVPFIISWPIIIYIMDYIEEEKCPFGHGMAEWTYSYVVVFTIKVLYSDP